MDNKVVIALVAGLLVLVAGYYLLRTDAVEEVVEDVDFVDETMFMNDGDVFMNETMVFNERVVQLSAVDASVVDQSGTALLMETAEGLVVEVNASPLETQQPAHIHVGECPGVGAILYDLNPVVNGVSTTVLPVTMDELMAQLPLAINLHQSQENIEVYTACGEL